MFFPKVNPVVEGLNSYYIIIDKLIEHFRGEVGTGVIFFRGSLSKGAVFFESDHFMESFFIKNDQSVTGEKALKYIVENCGKNNYEIYIYYVEPEYIYLWSEISKVPLQNKTKVDDTNNFRGVVEKLLKSKSLGLVSITGKKDTYSIFCAYGEIIGVNLNGLVKPFEDIDYKDFVKKCEYLLAKGGYELELLTKEKLKTTGNRPVMGDEQKEPVLSNETINIMSNFISIFDHYITDNKKIKQEFIPLLNKKFIENVDSYDFLDPFAAEFVYNSGKISFSGKVSEKKFVESIVVCLGEIANEQGLVQAVKPLYKDWDNNFGDLISRYNIAFPFK